MDNITFRSVLCSAKKTRKQLFNSLQTIFPGSSFQRRQTWGPGSGTSGKSFLTPRLLFTTTIGRQALWKWRVQEIAFYGIGLTFFECVCGVILFFNKANFSQLFQEDFLFFQKEAYLSSRKSPFSQLLVWITHTQWTFVSEEKPGFSSQFGLTAASRFMCVCGWVESEFVEILFTFWKLCVTYWVHTFGRGWRRPWNAMGWNDCGVKRCVPRNLGCYYGGFLVAYPAICVGYIKFLRLIGYQFQRILRESIKMFK